MNLLFLHKNELSVLPVLCMGFMSYLCYLYLVMHNSVQYASYQLMFVSCTNNTTGVTSGAATVNVSGVAGFTTDFKWGLCCSIFSFRCSQFFVDQCFSFFVWPLTCHVKHAGHRSKGFNSFNTLCFYLVQTFLKISSCLFLMISINLFLVWNSTYYMNAVSIMVPIINISKKSLKIPKG